MREKNYPKGEKHEIDMPNANQTLAHPMQTIFHALGSRWFALGPQAFLDTNMLV